ncbi:MAG: nucleotidyltransferase family protein [Chromatiaceae bacterium]|nr:nucleotidyltransferase family protein [Chromatiaceae bacterium]MCP5422394.1 nucleotidyltransferase family protein [Chromatiaceae bacterium]
MNLLNEVLARPSVITHWGAREWNAFLPLARNARLLGRCRALFAAHDLADGVPQRVDDHLRGALTQTHYVQGQARRELRHVARCLAREGIQLMALKGLAYLVAGLPPSGWRNLSDIDLMVRRADIERAEQLLHTCGWVASGEHDTYDEHYYRDWMHEVPPLRHPARAVEVDVHHNLSPPVSRTQIDADKLWDAASEYTDEFGTRVFVLESADLLLHNAIHLFMNDELRGGLRDVVDFRDLYEHFDAAEAGFAERLVARATELGCGRALYYAARAAQRFAGLRTAPEFDQALSRFAPSAPAAALMDRLTAAVFAPRRPGMKRDALAVQALFIRSHWIRMPPLMLIRHLAHKAFLSRRQRVAEGDLPG